MAFMFLSYGPDSLELRSDDGHHFLFTVVCNGGGRSLTIGDARWREGAQPSNSPMVLEHAHRFASLCAEDCGLI